MLVSLSPRRPQGESLTLWVVMKTGPGEESALPTLHSMTSRAGSGGGSGASFSLLPSPAQKASRI